jgi:hypothetical protein
MKRNPVFENQHPSQGISSIQAVAFGGFVKCDRFIWWFSPPLRNPHFYLSNANKDLTSPH